MQDINVTCKKSEMLHARNQECYMQEETALLNTRKHVTTTFVKVSFKIVFIMVTSTRVPIINTSDLFIVIWKL